MSNHTTLNRSIRATIHYRAHIIYIECVLYYRCIGLKALRFIFVSVADIFTRLLPWFYWRAEPSKRSFHFKNWLNVIIFNSDEAVQKIEKKVTFARLMNKFQSEMSSTSSEIDPHSKRNLRRPCPNQGSDSTSSLECALGILYIYIDLTRTNNQNFGQRSS